MASREGKTSFHLRDPRGKDLNMMQCPSCSAPLLSSEARCVSCHALVNPQAQGTSALAPRLVTPQSLEGMNTPEAPIAGLEASPMAPVSEPKVSDDDAWRREVLERVRKRRQLRAHALPLFVEGQPAPAPLEEAAPPAMAPGAARSIDVSAPLDEDDLIEELPDSLEDVAPLPRTQAPDLLASLEMPMGNAPGEDPMADLVLRHAESEAPPSFRARAAEMPNQALVERKHPSLVSAPASPRSLVGDLPLVEPSRLEPPLMELPERKPAPARNSRAASMSDRVQAAFIDMGMWSGMSVVAFYFASRIARTSILGLGHAWQGLSLFAVVLGAAYILFFGGLSGATPGKIACGIQVRHYDGTSLGPLPSLARGVLGLLGIALLGIGIWPAFWDKDRRGLHDRATDSRVTIV
jgi:uncharacterized RDD family membrane protein YckC